MFIDYKIVEEKEVNGNIVYQKIRVYEGQVQSTDWYDYDTAQTIQSNQYTRFNLVQEIEYQYE